MGAAMMAAAVTLSVGSVSEAQQSPPPPVFLAQQVAQSGKADEPLGQKSAALARSFGCPINSQQCHLHCKDAGRKGGYCGGPWWKFKSTCICYKK
jgi:hypothetical protein